MNKNELTKRIAETTPLNQKEAAGAIDAFIDIVKDQLASGEKVQLVGFGSWEVKERAARTGVNPQTGQKIEISATKLPKFTPGKALKDVVNV
ncbi:MAG: HU family DNA-binding protein [bacterium]|nr:HU family DNA-binding protein [bacterium]|tara:strand:- start:3868 stop:4143 length:276 start_codon:yes stop_codon:yes gene_type:complete